MSESLHLSKSDSHPPIPIVEEIKHTYLLDIFAI
jgi:hypothetical protein